MLLERKKQTNQSAPLVPSDAIEQLNLLSVYFDSAVIEPILNSSALLSIAVSPNGELAGLPIVSVGSETGRRRLKSDPLHSW